MTILNVIYSTIMIFVPLFMTGGFMMICFRAFFCCRFNPKPVVSGLVRAWFYLVMAIGFVLFVVFYYYETLSSWGITLVGEERGGGYEMFETSSRILMK